MWLSGEHLFVTVETLELLSSTAQRGKVIPDGMGPLQGGVVRGGIVEDQNK